MADAPEECWGTGKRKNAIARVRLFPGDGNCTVNKKSLDEYFGREAVRMIARQPLILTKTETQFDVKANVRGGGNSAQAAAIRHGITRALIKANPDFRPLLKKEGYVTRDSREVERKKYGRHKARKRPQYSKR